MACSESDRHRDRESLGALAFVDLMYSKPQAHYKFMKRRHHANKMLYNLLQYFCHESNGLNNMKPFKLLLPAALACALLLAAPARAAEDASHFQLSAAIMEKLRSAEADMKALQKTEEMEAEVDPDQSIEAAIRKIDKDPQTLAVLAKHGLSGRDLVMSAHALLHAGTFVAMEKTADQKKAADLFKGYTKEQQANIELIRAIVSGRK
jgi:hypothetical protein